MRMILFIAMAFMLAPAVEISSEGMARLKALQSEAHEMNKTQGGAVR